MGEKVFALLFTVILFFGGVCSVSITSSPAAARIVNGFFSNTFSMVMKRVLSLKASSKAVMTGRSMMKFESGYIVETVFDGSKLGIEPYAVEVLPDGDLLILDSANSNLYKISSLSLYSRPKLVSGSADGYYGHVDGRLREARMNHPKGLTVDDRGNIYVADTDNFAIRKISETGITTIAGGKKGRGGAHVDGPSQDTKFSNDFDVVYSGSSCSLLVIDRGNKAIREIQLLYDDCAYQYGSGFSLGISVLIAAGIFGYMLALLQRRVGSIVSSQDETVNANAPYDTDQRSFKSLERPPLIPTEDEQEKQEESFLGSVGRLVSQTGASAAEIFGAVFPMLQKKRPMHQSQHEYLQQQRCTNSWPVQESIVIPDEDEPPMIEARTPTPRKTYAFMSNDSEKMQQLRQSCIFYSGLDGDIQQQRQTKMQQHHHQYTLPASQTHYEQNSGKTNEIVFGAVQEHDKQREKAAVKPLNHAFPAYDPLENINYRLNYA